MLSTATAAEHALRVPDAMDARAGKYLIFQLRDEEFGTSVLKVREIMKLQEITPVPQTPGYMRGVINVRGQVIPVIDLRTKFDLPAQEDTERTCIVVVRASTRDGEMPMGVIVDSVLEVLNLSAADVEDPPEYGDGAVPAMLLGMAKVKGKVKILLDMDRVLNSGEMRGLETLLR